MSFLFGRQKSKATLGEQDLSKISGSPYTSQLGASLASLQSAAAPAKVAMEASHYQKQAVPGSLPEFDKARNDVTQRINSQAQVENQTQQDALKRRFAAIGGLSSGAYIKNAGLTSDRIAASKADATGTALAGLGLEEGKAMRALSEAEQNRFFVSNEGVADRNSKANMFNSSQDMEFNKYKASLFGEQSKIFALDLDWRKAQQLGEQEKFNAEMARFQANQGGEGLFGGSGFLGLGG